MQQDVVQNQTHFLMDGSRIQRHNFIVLPAADAGGEYWNIPFRYR